MKRLLVALVATPLTFAFTVLVCFAWCGSFTSTGRGTGQALSAPNCQTTETGDCKVRFTSTEGWSWVNGLPVATGRSVTTLTIHWADGSQTAAGYCAPANGSTTETYTTEPTGSLTAANSATICAHGSGFTYTGTVATTEDDCRMGLFKGVSVKGNESGTIDANLNMTYRIHGTYMRSEDNSGS